MLLDITNSRGLAPVAEDADGLFVRAPRPTRRWTTGGAASYGARKPAPPPRRQSTPGCFHHKPSSAFRDVLDLLDAAEPHAPPGSPLRERVLALRACASNRVPGRAEHAAADFEDVLRHGAEHARDRRRRGNALLELARAYGALGETQAPKRLAALRDAAETLDGWARGSEADDEREDTAAQLREEFGLRAYHYHAGMTPKQRNLVQISWKDGRLSLIHI